MVNSLASGIPQSDANPILDYFDQSAELVEKHRRDMEAWRMQSQETVDRAILEPDAFYQEHPLPAFHPDPAAARAAVTVRSYLTLANDGQPVTGDLFPSVLRQRIAAERFGGRGADSDQAFLAEIQQEAQGRRDGRTLAGELSSRASVAAIVGAASPEDAPADFATWRAEAMGKPGYVRGMDFAYREAWEDTRAAVATSIEPYLGPLKEVWQGMKKGEAGEFFTAYQNVPEDQRPAFLASLRLLADALPADQQPTFWGNLAKQAGRDIGRQAINVMEGAGDALDTGNPLADYRDPLAVEQQRQQDLARRNFTDDILHIRDASYDPVKVLNPDSTTLRILERGAYAAPGAIATTAAALVPYAGTAATYFHMEQAAYRQTRQTLLDQGVSDAEATSFASATSGLVAIPQAALEKLGAATLVGKFPLFEKALAATANRLSSTAARVGARTGAIAAWETAIENTQDILPAILQDAASTIDPRIPGTEWRNGQDGFFDGYWENTASVFVTMLPLALVGGAAGVSREQRAATLASATDTQLRALGIAPDSVARIREAQGKGQFQTEQAVDSALQNLDPRSEDAKDATQELAEELQATREAIAAAQDTGVLPRFTRTAAGWTVYQDEQELGTAANAEEALRLAQAHTRALDNDAADQIAALSSLLESADAVAAMDGEGRTTTQDIRPGQTVTAAQQSAVSSADEARVLAQTAARERINGGDGGMSALVLGQSATQFKQRARATVNRINAGGSVLTVFHEATHGFYREALHSGRLTREDTVAILRALDTVLASRTDRDGLSLRFLPQNDADITDTILDEAVAELMEAEILRNRKSTIGNQQSEISRRLPPGVLTRNLSALARLAPGAAQKLSAFIEAVRAFWGLTFARSVAIKQAIRKREVDQAQLEQFTAKLFGVDEQDDFEQMARDAEAEILAGAELTPLAEGDPFSLGTDSSLKTENSDLANSLGSSRLASLTGDSIRRIQDPLRRAQAMERISRKLEELRLEAERLELIAGSKRLKRSLAKEAAMREAMRREELENEAWARHAAVLSDDDLTKLKSQPGHAHLSDPSSPLKGRLMSKTAAAKKHPDLFRANPNPAAYDGSETVSRTLFGGDLAPDIAAQEMFEAGLLREPTTDALWTLLESEARHVEGMKRVLEAAKADLREARTVARAETNAWLATQTDAQAANFSPRQEILRTLAALDAILSSVPPQIRGKVGGYMQAARIADPDAGLEFLRERLAKVDTELEKWLREQYDLEFRALLAKARPEKDEAGRKPRGKIGADIHDLFRALQDAMTLTSAETEAEALRLETLAAQEDDLTPDQQSHATLLAGLIRLAGDWGKATAARREAAVLEATRLYEGGYAAHKTQMLRQREDRAKKRSSLAAATGKAGTRTERRARDQRDTGTRTGRVLKAGLSLLSFEQLVQKAFGEGTAEAEALVDWERRAAHAKADAVQHKLDQLDDLFTSLAGGKFKGEQLRHRLADPDAIKATDARGVEHAFSQLEAITLTLMARQEDGRRHMTGHVNDQGKPVGEWNFDQDFIDRIEDQLSPDARAVRLHLAEQYAAEYDRLNSVFRQLYGVNLPRHAHYSPLTVKPAQAGAGQMLDPVTGTVMSGAGLTPGSLKTRSQSAIAEPDFRDALQTYIAHAKQMEHWMAYAPFATEAMALLNSRDVGNSVEAAAGKEAVSTLRSWLDYFAQGGTRDAAAHLAGNQLLNRMAGRAAAVALVGRVSVLAIQSTQLAAALAEMPAAAYLTRLARLFAGRLDWSAALRSDYIQRRRAQMPPVVQQAMEGLASSRPNRLKAGARKMGETIAGADALFTAGTYAITYDYHLTQARQLGIADPHAYARQAAERSTDRVAQPVRPGTRSLYEVTGTNPAVRILWSFASDSRQKLMLAAYALGSKKSKGAKARALAVTWLAGGLLASVIRATMRDLRDDDDDEFFDEQNWDPKRLALASLTGPFQGLPFFGDAIESAVFKIAGEWMPESNLFSTGPRAIETAAKLLEGDGPDDLETAVKDAETLLSGAGLVSESAAAAASVSHLIRDLLAISGNALGD